MLKIYGLVEDRILLAIRYNFEQVVLKKMMSKKAVVNDRYKDVKEQIK